MGLGLTGSTCAAVVGLVQNFSAVNSTTGWASVGAVSTSFGRTVNAADGTGGDGIAGDGALLFNIIDSISGNEAVAFSFSGTIQLGESYTLSTSSYNPNSSYNNYNIQLINVTDGTVLAQTGFIFQANSGAGIANRTLNYSALAADEGDTLGIRIVEGHDNAARDMALDQLTLTVVPEPSVTLLGGLGILALLRRRRH